MTDYAVYQSHAVDEAGNVLAGANVEVRSEVSGSLVTLYSARTGTALANPFTADNDGYFKFHTVGDFLKIRVYTGSSAAPTAERIFRYVPVGLSQGYDIDQLMRLVPDGSVTAPGFAFAGDTNTGLYRIGTDIIGVATAGSERLRIDASGRFGLGGATAVGSNVLGVANIQGAVNAQFFRVESTVLSDVTTLARGYLTVLGTQAAAFSTNINHFEAAQGTIGAGSTVTVQKGFYAGSGLTGATTNYGFHSDLAASGTARWNFYAAGTAPNYMAGALGIGSTSLTTSNMRIAKTATGGVTFNNVLNESIVQSDVTTSYSSFASTAGTQAASFTLTNLQHFDATSGTLGASSAVTNLYGFRARSTLTIGTNNYGFYADIASASGRWNFYANGTARNYMNGALSIGATTDPGTGGLFVNGVANVAGGTATPAGGSTSARLLLGTTAGFGIYYGSGAPSVSAAQGSIYIRSDGSSTSTRLYVNTDGSTTWTNFTSAT